jgi:hypothetical protein
LTGIPGIGKSRNSLELLRTFCTENQGYSAIWLQRISEWSELINADDNLIVLIDDVFGRTNITFDGNEDLKPLDKIYSTIQKGTVKVIVQNVRSSSRLFRDLPIPGIPVNITIPFSFSFLKPSVIKLVLTNVFSVICV